MGRILKIAILSIGLTAFIVLTMFGVAIWVFIPLFPAGFIFAIAVYEERQRNHHKATVAEKPQQHDLPKAA